MDAHHSTLIKRATPAPCEIREQRINLQGAFLFAKFKKTNFIAKTNFSAIL
jgi:hypothetical protein